MQAILVAIYFIVSAALVLLILVQQGRGADAGVTFGSGNASSVFGAAGSTSFLVRLTTAFAILFFILNLILGVRANTLSYEFAQDLDNDGFEQSAEVVE